MNLIAYSDSESDGEATPAPKPALKPAVKLEPKPVFQKVVNRSNPGRIKVNLPGASHSQVDKDDIEAEAPPAKKARTGGEAFSGFNAMLPAPKKPNVNAATGGATSGKKGLGKGLGSGVNLKTGAEPAFQRASKADEEDYDENGDLIKKEALKKEDFRAMLNLPPPKTEPKTESMTVVSSKAVEAKPQPEIKDVAMPKFMPMSVGRGKKRPVASRPAVLTPEEVKPMPAPVPAPASVEPKHPARPKVSLFSVSQPAGAPAKTQFNGEYQPLLHGIDEDEDASVPDEDPEAQSTCQTTSYIASAPPPGPASNDLTSIASELNLSEAERRQLFGRRGQGPDVSSAKIVEFNTDTEYAHNEQLRQQGETVQHNALKSISGTGKNSLRSLVNVATSQKDALEEHWNTGRRNRKEAGNKYGW